MLENNPVVLFMVDELDSSRLHKPRFVDGWVKNIIDLLKPY